MSTFREIIESTPYKEQSHVLELVINQYGDSYVLENVAKLIGSYTFSIWTKANKNCSVQFDVLGTIKIAEVTTDWKKYVYTVKTDDLSNGKSIAIKPDNNTTTYYYEGFLSEGTIDNSWLPAPEDDEAQMESIKSEFIQKADSIEEKVTVNDGKISSLIVDVNGIRGKIANAEGTISELQQTASSLSSSISDNKQNISKLEQQANEFSVSVSKTYATKQEMNAAIKVQSDSITQSVKQQIDNIEVGGRNLLIGTKNGVSKTGTGVENEATKEYKYSDYGKEILHNGIQKEITISFDWKTSDAITGTIEVQSCFSNWNSFGITELSEIKQSGHVVTTVKIPEDWNGSENTGMRFRLNSVTGTVDFSNLKVEVGNKATDWTPAPEDVDAEIDSLNTRVTTNESSITTNANGITALSSRVSNNETAISELEITANGITSRVSSVEQDAENALVNAANAQSTADSKAKVFTATPTVPYKVGDLWVQGNSGDVMKCKTARSSGSYTASDWEKASKYTDDTKANSVDSKVTTLTEKVNVTVKDVKVYYAINTSSTSAPTSGWSTTPPTWENGKYIWSKTTTTLTNGTSTTTNPVCITGAKGDTGATGATGATGTGITSITTEYYLSTSKTTQTGGSWVTTQPAWSTGKYLWTRSKIVYKNPTSTAYTTPVCDSSWDAINDVKVGGRNYIKGGKGTDDSGLFKNFNTIDTENGYAEHTLTSKNQHTSVNIAPGFVLDCRDYEVGKQMVFSYDIMYTKWDFPEGTNRQEFWIGQRYTNQSKTDGDKTGQWKQVTAHTPPIVGSNGCVLNKWYHVEKLITIPSQAAEGIGTAGSFQLYNSNADVAATVTFRLKNIKLEYGNKATDWTPAPEDVEQGIQDAQSSADKAQGTADSVGNRVTVAESQIKQVKDSISMMVTDENGSSLMTQTSDGWTFNIGGIQNTLDDARDKLGELTGSVSGLNDTTKKLDSLITDITKKTAYINMATDSSGNPCIELGKIGDPFKVRITNTSVDFIEGSSRIAYISNNALYIEKAIIKNELQIGDGSGFIWRKRSNGNMGLRRT